MTTDIPARLDRLPWSKWHAWVVVALGITWLLDGLEGTIAGSLAGILERRDTLGMSDAQFGLSGSVYLLGSVTGALLFGYATDRLGRKRLFLATLALYVGATLATATAWSFTSYAVFRALTGAAIGGEYAAINSAVDELIPSRVRGHVDLVVNATFWIGAALGAAGAVVLLNVSWIRPDVGWRFAVGIGAAIGVAVLAMRRHVPESPRWLMIHGREDEARTIAGEIERHVTKDPGSLPAPEGSIRIVQRSHTPWREIWRTIAYEHRRRSILGFVLMVTQAFFYNAVLFTYGLVLLRYFHVPPTRLGLHLLPLAAGNFLGPLVLGRLFDSVGRKRMITATYVLSGLLMAVTGGLFRANKLDLTSLSVAWSVVFFFASTAASSAYLTVSEVFPLEVRAVAISIFYTCGTFAGGVGGPVLFGYLVGTGSRQLLALGYAAGAFAMILGGVVAAFFGVDAERKSLESIAEPLSSQASRAPGA